MNADQRPPQRPLELILARNFLSSLSTAAFLVDGEGMLAFYNEAAGSLLGRRFEEVGPQRAQDWGARHGPFDEDGAPIPFGELDLTQGLRRGRPGHSKFHIRTEDDKDAADRGERDADPGHERPARGDGLLLARERGAAE